MNNMQTLITPARQAELTNQTPVPQTVCGTLEHTELDNDSEPITDIPPDFGWMSEMPFLSKTFQWPPAQGTSQYTIRLNKFITLEDGLGLSYPWVAFPLSLHKYFNAEIQLRFIAVKPSRTPGKIIFFYYPSGNSYNLSNINSVRQRPIKKEWDLQQNTTCELTIPGFNPLRLRNPRDIYVAPVAGRDGAAWNTPSSQSDFGVVVMTSAIPYAPGSVFPDSFTILMEQSLKNSSYATPCDSHGTNLDYFRPS